MKLSTKGRYGARAMLNLAIHFGEGPVSIKDIAHEENISERYLEHIMSKLASRGLVKSLRGKSGGFALARDPRDIRLSDVVQTLEGSLAPVECVDNPDHCSRKTICVTYDIWSQLNDAINQTLGSITLKDMVERYEKKTKAEENMMYHI